MTSRVFETQERRDVHANKRQPRRGVEKKRPKNGRQLQGEGRSGGSGSGARGSLPSPPHANGERRVVLTRPLTERPAQLLLRVSSAAPLDPGALLHILFCFFAVGSFG